LPHGCGRLPPARSAWERKGILHLYVFLVSLSHQSLSHPHIACIFASNSMFSTWHFTSYLSIASFFSISCIVVDGSCTTLVNPDTGDAKAFVLDYSFDSSDPSDRRIPQTLFHIHTRTITHTRPLGIERIRGYACIFANGT
jgi:hypothetical protein